MLSSHKSVKWAVTAVAVVTSMMLTSAAAQADIINVPGDAPTIQAGIELAVDGDEVVVAESEDAYFENINFLGKAITVRSTFPLDPVVVSNTIIRAFGSVVTFENDEGPTSIISGMTINSGDAFEGGGVFVCEASPTITHCVISENEAFRGAGIWLENSSATISGCTIIGNVSNGTGGGIYSIGGSPTLVNCTLSDNVAFRGGGMRADDGELLVIRDCVFRENISLNAFENGGAGLFTSDTDLIVDGCEFDGNRTFNGDGAGMFRAGGDVWVANCRFRANEATSIGFGGAIFSRGSSTDTMTVVNCSFFENEARLGGALFTICCPDGPVTVLNSTFAGNLAHDTGGAVFMESSGLVVNSILWGNFPNQISQGASVMYSDVQGGYAGVGNIDANPQFVSLNNGDLRLLPGSLCIDAADNTAVPPDHLDMDGDGDFDEPIPFDLAGNPRFVDDPDTRDTGVPCCDLSIVDMGAYEFQAVTSVWIVDDDALNDPGPGNPDDSDPLEDGSSDHPFDEIQEAIDAAFNGDIVIVLPGTYLEDINLLGKAIRVQSSDGANVTTIDAGGLGTVVTCTSDEGEDTILEGFTITGGSASFGNGGGMLNVGSSPTVLGCMFLANQATSTGGGMYNSDGSSPNIIGCTFTNNNGGFEGGAIVSYSSSPTLSNCTFVGNVASSGAALSSQGADAFLTVNGCTFSNNMGSQGGAIRVLNGASLVAIDCTFSDNSANAGGGLFCGGDTASVLNCMFTGNTATSGNGGAIANSGPSCMTLVNCTIIDSTGNFGGGLSSSSGCIEVVNCTFAGNIATNGGAMRFGSAGASVSNCIVWDNMPNQIVDCCGADTFVQFTNIQDGWDGAGASNIDADPLFVDEVGGDYHISGGSPCIDAADNTAVPKGIVTDLDGNPRFVDDPASPDCWQAPGSCGDPPVVDMGAYEFQGITCPWDLDGDVSVGILDLLALLAAWGTDPGGPPDFDGDGTVGILDLLTLLANWGACA